MTPAISAVVPCCNEEDNVALLEARLAPALERLGVSWEIIAVDDGSVDATAARLDALARRLPSLRVLRHSSNRGLGAALRTAIRGATGEWVAVLDADMTFAPEQLETLWRAAQAGADCVAGSPALGSYSTVPWTRRLPSLLLNRLYALLFGRGLTAFTAMFRLYRAAPLKALDLGAEGFEINAEILVRLLQRGARVVELPATLGERAAGSSKLRRLRELRRHLGLIARLLRG